MITLSIISFHCPQRAQTNFQVTFPIGAAVVRSARGPSSNFATFRPTMASTESAATT